VTHDVNYSNYVNLFDIEEGADGNADWCLWAALIVVVFVGILTVTVLSVVPDMKPHWFLYCCIVSGFWILSSFVIGLFAWCASRLFSFTIFYCSCVGSLCLFTAGMYFPGKTNAASSVVLTILTSGIGWCLLILGSFLIGVMLTLLTLILAGLISYPFRYMNVKQIAARGLCLSKKSGGSILGHYVFNGNMEGLHHEEGCECGRCGADTHDWLEMISDHVRPNSDDGCTSTPGYRCRKCGMESEHPYSIID